VVWKGKNEATRITIGKLVLGASKFPRATLQSSKAFEKAATSVAVYFLRGFDLPIETFFWFFDSVYEPNALDDQIATKVRTRIQQLQTGPNPATDLIVYYVGHGSFDEQRRYYLALKSTRDENQSVSSLHVDALMVTLGRVAGDLRKFVIIDACFAGEAAFLQSGVNEAVGQQIRRLTPPRRGTAFYCSSSRDVVSEFLRDESNTVFTQALTEVLWQGTPSSSDLLSLEDVNSLVINRLAQDPSFIRPEIHVPSQPEGNAAAEVKIFPNGPRRTAIAAAQKQLMERQAVILDYIRKQADEQARHAEKLKSEHQAQQDDLRRKILEEQDRERAQQEKALYRYSSEAEKTFCDEAERVQKRELDFDLLKDWLGWKAQELKIQSGTLEQRARDQKGEAATNRFYAGNVRDHLTKAQRVGSDDTIQLLRSSWRECIEKAEAAEQAAADYEDQAEDARFAAEYYMRANSDPELIGSLKAEAQKSGNSFQEVVEQRITPSIKQMQRGRARSRFIANVWKWTVRLAIAFLILSLLVIGSLHR
jgi:hypothetical protein